MVSGPGLTQPGGTGRAWAAAQDRGLAWLCPAITGGGPVKAALCLKFEFLEIELK